MTIKQISLYDRLDRLNGNEAAHPEYDSAVVRSMACMPIIEYLADYDTFCDFQIITEVREDLPYQVMAQVIAGQAWSPEDLKQMVDILAAPIVQIEKAYRQRKPALLPYRKRGRTTQRVESLASRLEGVGALAGPPYACHGMPIQRFFRAVSKLAGNLHLQDAYWDTIRPYAPDESTLFRQAVYDISALQSPDRDSLLYKLLVEPFAALPTESEVVT